MIYGPAKRKFNQWTITILFLINGLPGNTQIHSEHSYQRPKVTSAQIDQVLSRREWQVLRGRGMLWIVLPQTPDRREIETLNAFYSRDRLLLNRVSPFCFGRWWFSRVDICESSQLWSSFSSFLSVGTFLFYKDPDLKIPISAGHRRAKCQSQNDGTFISSLTHDDRRVPYVKCKYLHGFSSFNNPYPSDCQYIWK